MIIKQAHHISELTIFTKDAHAAMFDPNSYNTSTLYLKNPKLAKAYVEAKFPGCEYKIREVSAIHDATSGRWALLSPMTGGLALDSTFNMNGKVYQFNTVGLERCCPDDGDWVIGLTAVPCTIEKKAESKPFRRDKFFSVQGVMLNPAPTIKDITHLVYINDMGFLYLARGNGKIVELVSSEEIKQLSADLHNKHREFDALLDIKRKTIDVNSLEFRKLSKSFARLVGLELDLEEAEEIRGYGIRM